MDNYEKLLLSIKAGDSLLVSDGRVKRLTNVIHIGISSIGTELGKFNRYTGYQLSGLWPFHIEDKVDAS